MENWPNFFIVGAPRSGTTFLHDFLRQIPNVFVPKIKEPSFFAPTINSKKKLTKPIRDEKKYLELFNQVTTEEAIGEASPAYLWDPESPKLIKNKIPNAKIIMILRNPIERSFSHYLLGFGLGYQKLPFKEAMINALNSPDDYSESRIARSSFYFEQVSRYLELFPSSNVKIYIFEEFFTNIDKSLINVLRFLNVSTDFPKDLEIEKNPPDIAMGKLTGTIVRNPILRTMVREFLPESGGPVLRKFFKKNQKKPEMSLEDRKFVSELFNEDITKLEQLLNKKLPWHA